MQVLKVTFAEEKELQKPMIPFKN